MDITKDFDWGFELNERFFIFKTFLGLLDQKLNHFIWEVYERHTLRIFLSVSDNIVVQVIDDDIHDKHIFVVDVLLWNVSDAFFELPPPLFCDVQ